PCDTRANGPLMAHPRAASGIQPDAFTAWPADPDTWAPFWLAPGRCGRPEASAPYQGARPGQRPDPAGGADGLGGIRNAQTNFLGGPAAYSTFIVVTSVG